MRNYHHVYLVDLGHIINSLSVVTFKFMIILKIERVAAKKHSGPDKLISCLTRSCLGAESL